ncbi:hypothetical protein [Tenacibaculum sp. C7A-26P2]|uniref:hypothetical protein n=1 Tax=Tenacibaculum sp. C7A-26P2 TaxID=3447504 RepID=UPI003F866815
MVKRFIFGILLLVTTTRLEAQRSNISPYSYFGIGESFGQLTVEQSSMGGIGVAMKDINHLNFTNPAAIADLKITTYSLGGEARFLTLKESNAMTSGNSINLSYIALGIPLGNKMGLTFGLQPFSKMGYALLNREYLGDELQEVSRFSGSGGTNRLYAGFGAYLIKGFSLGIEAGFVFGSIENNIYNQKYNVSLGTKHERELNIRGGEIKLGAQYETELKNNLKLTTGATLAMNTNLSATGSERLYSLSLSNNGLEIGKDTLYSKSISGNIKMPLRAIFGVGLGKKDKWYAELSQEFREEWSTSNQINLSSGRYQYESGRKLSFGGYYIPKINSISSYWDRVTYRAGVRFEKLGLLVDGLGTGKSLTSINDYGINFGLGLPLPKLLSSVNLGFEYGQRGTIDNNLIKENYYNIKLSLSLNSLSWFIKRKID